MVMEQWLLSNGLVFKALDSQSRDPASKPFDGSKMIKSRLSPRSDSAALRQLNPSIKRSDNIFLIFFFCFRKICFPGSVSRTFPNKIDARALYLKAA